MKFLKEVTESVEYQIEETDSSKPKQYFIEGIFMQGDVKNRNGRIYPTQTLVKEPKRYTEQKINSKQSLGELNHPDSAAINPERASHLITKLWVEGNNIMGRAKVLDTPMGKIVKTLLSPILIRLYRLCLSYVENENYIKYSARNTNVGINPFEFDYDTVDGGPEIRAGILVSLFKKTFYAKCRANSTKHTKRVIY